MLVKLTFRFFSRVKGNTVFGIERSAISDSYLVLMPEQASH